VRTTPNGFLFGLAPDGVYPATNVTISAVRSYRTISPLPRKRGGIFSVALSIDSRRPGVTWHLILWSPDFPLSLNDSDYLADFPDAKLLKLDAHYHYIYICPHQINALRDLDTL
jgi:hypothetical protein